MFILSKRAWMKSISTRQWTEVCKAVRLMGVPLLDLRHTWTSWQVQAEALLSHLQELGGWAQFTMVQRYAHLSPAHLRQYADRTLLGDPSTQKPRIYDGVNVFLPG